jgi:hypothetical protein
MPAIRLGLTHAQSTAPSGRMALGAVPGVKTPDLVLLSLRDEDACPQVV